MTICFIIGDILANKHCTRLPFRKKATNSSQFNIVSLTSQIIWSLEFLDCMHHTFPEFHPNLCLNYYLRDMINRITQR